MDANGTRFHLLLGQDDWGACLLGSPFNLNGGGSREEVLRLSDAWAALSPDEGGVSLPSPNLAVPGWDKECAEVTLPPRVFQFKSAARQASANLATRRGVGHDLYGNWYWIADDEHGIFVQSAGSGTASSFWRTDEVPEAAVPSPAHGGFHPYQPAPAAPLILRGLAVTTEDYLVAGVLYPPGLLIFDLHAGGPPVQWTWADAGGSALAFAPFDMVPTPDGGLWVLDRPGGGASARLWALDQRLRVLSPTPPPAPSSRGPTFQPLAGGISPLSNASDEPACLPLSGVAAAAAVALAAADPIAVEALPDGTVLVLDNGGDGDAPLFSMVWRYDLHGAIGVPVSTRMLAGMVDEELQRRFSLAGHDFAFLPATQRSPSSAVRREFGTLMIVRQDGDQTYAFSVGQDAGRQLVLRPLPQYLPMRLFGGKGLVGYDDRAFYDVRDRWVPLTRQPRPVYAAEATILTPARLPGVMSGPEDRPAFDGGQPDCVWHRLLIDASIPNDADTGIDVWSRTANLESDLPGAPWMKEPPLYRRSDDSELPYLPPYPRADGGTWELLFQQARGRYLQLKIHLRGNGRTSPRLHALRAYFPRFSYLDHYLPAAYREDPASGSFLDRFLANVEGLYTTIEDRIASIQALFDVRTVPAEYLDWLATWFGVIFDAGWEAQRKRLFLAHANELFSQRGTVLGLIRAIRLATDRCPTEKIFSPAVASDRGTIRLVEQFRLREAPGVVFGDPSEPETPSLTLAASDWTPRQGSIALHERYQAYLQQQYETQATANPSRWPLALDALNETWSRSVSDFAQIQLPPVQPSNPAEASDWQRFLKSGLGFTYDPVTQDALPAYRDFLARRYGQIEDLNRIYGTGYTDFKTVSFPSEMPAAGDPLRDWIQFVSVVAPTLHHAHRFSVLIPTRTGAQTVEQLTNPYAAGTLLDQVRRVVQAEAPAHTVFELKEFWALFRVGEARLGFDTLVDRGSRLSPVVLDSSYLAQGFLAPSHPWQIANRFVLSRDRPGECRLW